ncbi:receptor-type tyrosine-protein phosphatase T-like isoform X7 [Mytilus californianus]|uniref:receptor-type tyrosine-protein phosphatase T-like isoform X7 n=1 Tax=Mytilus californianus TaxID=6549 RepID=UPI002247A0BF|nr:receptor-type tyrosine-protein phosphatase T-like isoform X7 [Mytilus californianus]
MTGNECIHWMNASAYTTQDKNYCRTPAGESDNVDGPWCYINNFTGRETCNVPVCDGAQCPDLSVRPNLISKEGKTTFHYGEKAALTCKAGYKLKKTTTLTCLQSGNWNERLPYCEEVNCYNKYNRGQNYVGNVSKTLTGEPCLNWKVYNSRFVDLHENHTYCRNPLPSEVDRPFCYTGAGFVFEKCIITVCDCRNSTSDHNYDGQINITRNGHTCIHWNKAVNYQSQHENYCRTPAGDAYNDTGPWCYFDTKGGRDSCNVPICDGASCPDLSLRSHLQTQDNKDSYRYGETVNLACETGYILNGLRNLSCQETGNWSNTIPTCEVVTCHGFSNEPHQNWHPSKRPYIYNDNVTFTCDEGYELSSSTNITCQSDGTWSDIQPNCTGVLCSSIPHIEFMLPQNPKEYNFPSSVNISCKEGYQIKGPTMLQCQTNGNWSSPPICTGVLCSSIPHIEFMLPQNSKEYSFPSSVNISCKEGYQIKGPTMLQCQTNGNWSSPPICTGVLCNSIPDIEYMLPKTSNKYSFPSSVNISCKEGYQIKGPTTLQCQTNGNWSSPPLCTAIVQRPNTSLLPAVFGGLGAILTLVLIIVVVVVIRRRSKKGKPKSVKRKEPSKDINNPEVYAQVSKTGNTDESRLSHQITTNGATYDNQDEEKREYYSFAGDLKISGTAISINDFYDYVDKGRGTKGPIEKEFEKLKKHHLKETKTASLTENIGKNKYKNVFPYDETRVILDIQPGKGASDYINASFINGYGQVKKYIAAQGPLEPTINDFWGMIWQYDCGKIVMLTNVCELGKQKCKQYWPDPESKTKQYGSTEILLIDEDVYSDFTIRTLKIVKENQSKTVKQFHFTAWPDKDVPKYASSIVHFRHKVFSSNVSPNGPIIIHCSAGIGRTGTFIALDYIVNEANDLKYIDVFKCVETLRRQRVNMVQTARQYVFLHEAILEAVMCPNSGIPSKDFPDLYKELMMHDSSRNKTKLQVEYQRMNAMCEKHEDNVFDQGKIPENRTKNRDSTILPVEYEMPILSTFVEGHNEYINAVFLPGYKNKKAFIVTQLPLYHTKMDLWRLVYDHNIQTIVMLNQVKEDTDAYWPENQETPIQIGAFKIELTTMESKPYCNCLHLTLKYKTWDERSLVMYQAKFWDDNDVVPDSKEDLFNLLFEVENKSNNGDNSPILVHCLNGCDKSGLYCVLATVLERLRIEQDIDIQHIIKQTRNRRPQIILNYEQFRFIYDAVLEYLKQFETYSNFQ